MSLLARSLEERRLPLGGWSYLKSSQTSVEATSLAAMALNSESSAASGSGIEQLLHLQRRDGGWPAFLGDSAGSWTTALALCALNGMTDFAGAREKAFHWLIAERGREAHWIWRWKFKTADRNVRFDPDKYGWPWISGSASGLSRQRSVSSRSSNSRSAIVPTPRKNEFVSASRCFWIAPA